MGHHLPFVLNNALGSPGRLQDRRRLPAPLHRIARRMSQLRNRVWTGVTRDTRPSKLILVRPAATNPHGFAGLCYALNDSCRKHPAFGTNILFPPSGMRMKAPVKPFRVSVVQCRGTPYEVGRAQARLFAVTPKGRAFLRKKTAQLPWWFDIRAEQRMFAKFAPVLWEELVGIADELGVSMERVALRFGNDSMRPPIGACSAMMTTDVYGRNYDNMARYYAAQFTLLQASGSNASIGSTHGDILQAVSLRLRDPSGARLRVGLAT